MQDHYKERLTRFYGAYEPSKISTIDLLLAKVNGKPENFKMLIAKLTSKYGPEPEDEEESEYESEEESDEEEEEEEDDEEELTSSMAKTRIGEIVDPFEDRLKRFYKAHDPRRLPIVQTLVRKMGGKRTYQEELIGLLVEKYGPEPQDRNELSMQEQCDNFLEARLNRFYGAFKPEALPLVDGLVIRTRGVPSNQDQLITMMTDKYGPEPMPKGTYDVAAAQAEIVGTFEDEEEDEEEEEEFDEEEVRQRLIRFYSTYQPEKISTVGSMLKKAEGSLVQVNKLFALLVQKYGPEPEEDDEEEGEQGSDSDEEDEEDSGLFRKVVYNPVDGFPPEYSEFLPTFKQSLPWLLQACPELKLTTQKGKTVAEYAQGLQDSGLDLLVGAGEKVSSKRHGGAALPNRKKGGKNKGGGATEVTIELVKRNKRRNVTIVIGLDSFDVKIKQAAKALGKKFACGASVNKMPTGGQCIEIQGDVIYDCPGVVVEMFPTVKPDVVFRIQDTKKSKAF